MSLSFGSMLANKYLIGFMFFHQIMVGTQSLMVGTQSRLATPGKRRGSPDAADRVSNVVYLRSMAARFAVRALSWRVDPQLRWAQSGAKAPHEEWS